MKSLLVEIGPEGAAAKTAPELAQAFFDGVWPAGKSAESPSARGGARAVFAASPGRIVAGGRQAEQNHPEERRARSLLELGERRRPTTPAFLRLCREKASPSEPLLKITDESGADASSPARKNPARRP
jgi:hypothetical protein